MVNRNSRAAISIVLFTAIVLTLAACSVSEEAPITVPDGAQAGDLVGLEACTYEAGDVEYAADCGTLVVPENRNDSNSRLIALPVIRIRATGDNAAEPIFYLSGGPGESNVRLSRVSWFIDQHDVVLVGYRGVDGSVRLDCPEVSELIRNLPGDMLSGAVQDAWVDANARCARRLQDEGVDPDGFTVVEVVDDIESARTALGYEKINLFSISYGTRLAMIYAWRHPESIYRSAMIAINPPGGMVYDVEMVDQQLEYYADLCAETPKCSARTDDLAESVRTVADNMPERWLGLPINGGMIRAASFESLSGVSDAPMVFDVWLAAEKGDYSGMVLLTLAGPMMFANASTWGDNTAKNTSTGDYESGIDFQASFNPPESIMGSPRSELAASMEGWPANIIPEEYRQVQPSDVETLLVSGSIDFWTPAQLAEDEFLPSLSTGQHVVVAEAGHGEMLSLQPEATRHLLNTFYDTGVGDDSLFTYQPWEFKVGFGFPLIAKLVLVIVVLLSIGLIALVWFIVRRIRRHSATT